jgi:hypothetical protein
MMKRGLGGGFEVAAESNFSSCFCIKVCCAPMQQFDDDPRSIKMLGVRYASWIIIELLHRRTADFVISKVHEIDSPGHSGKK